MKPLNITHATDPTGWAVVGVRLSNAPDRTAWLYREDFERINRQYPGSWSLADPRKSHSYVRVTSGKRSVYVARLVAHAQHRTAVRYWDDDPLNLRGANLSTTGGPGGVPKRKRKASAASPDVRRVSSASAGGARV